MFTLVEVMNSEGGTIWIPYKGAVYGSADEAFEELRCAAIDVKAYRAGKIASLGSLAEWYSAAMGDVVVYNPELS